MTIREPSYAQDIVVGIIFQQHFAWYIIDKEYLYLDVLKYDHAVIASGYNQPYIDDGSWRFGISILDEVTVGRFLADFADTCVSASTLTSMIIARKKKDPKDDLLDFSPCMLINFDQKQLSSLYPEMIRFEAYIPDGWIGSYRDFLEELPKEEQYWIVDGQNLYNQ